MKKTFNKKIGITLAMAFCAAMCAGVGMTSVNASANETQVQTLAGFECAGASVNAQELGMRFVFNLSGDAVAKKDLTSGVVYMPYDMYQGDINAFVKEQEKSLTTEFSWQDNVATADETDMIGYTYLSADMIPSTMYNRVLLVRGYMEDGEGKVYYTEAIKTSMAYSAWKGIDALPAYEEQLKAYMGPYTLTYDGGEVNNLYYGDTVALPTQVGGYNVAAWYWDAGMKDDVAADDYATGSMNVYYDLEDVVVSGTVSCADAIDMSSVKIAVNGVETNATVSENGEYSLSLDPGTYTLKFYTGYYAAEKNVAVTENTTVTAELTSHLYEVGTYGNISSTSGLVEADDLDGVYTVSSARYALYMPNTATDKDYDYKVTTSDVSYLGNEADAYMGVAITNGEFVLSVTISNWNIIKVNIASSANGEGFQYFYESTVNGWVPRTYRVLRDGDALKVFFGEELFFTFTANGIESTKNNLGWTATSAEDFNTALATFFEEDAKHVVGVANISDLATQATFTSNWSLYEEYVVSGTVSCADVIDMTSVKIAINGEETNATVSENGEYSLIVNETGDYELKFYNDSYESLTMPVTVNGDMTQDVVLYNSALKVGGNMVVNGKTVETVGWDCVAFGGANALGNIPTASTYYIAMPNTVTTRGYTFSTVRQVDAAEQQYGIGVTNGTISISMELRQWNGRLVINNAGEVTAYPFYFDIAGMFYAPITMTVTSQAITWSVTRSGRNLTLSITNTGDVHYLIDDNYDNIADTSASAGLMASFFNAGQETAVVLTASDSAAAPINGLPLSFNWYSQMSYEVTPIAPLTVGGSMVVNGKTVKTIGWDYVAVGGEASLPNIPTASTYFIAMPGTVTTQDYTFSTVRQVDAEEQQFGVGVTNGTLTISMELRQWNGRLVINNAGEVTSYSFFFDMAGMFYAPITMEVTDNTITWSVTRSGRNLTLLITKEGAVHYVIDGNYGNIADTSASAGLMASFFNAGQETAVVLTASDPAAAPINGLPLSFNWYSGMSFTVKED